MASAWVEVPLSGKKGAGKVTLLDTEDYLELLGKKFYVHGKFGHVCLWIDGRVRLLHRVIMDPSDDVEIDHINRKGWDNRRANLRYADSSVNKVNRHFPTRGTVRVGNKFAARGWIKDQGAIHLGMFETREEAVVVAHEWRLKYMPGYTGE